MLISLSHVDEETLELCPLNCNVARFVSYLIFSSGNIQKSSFKKFYHFSSLRKAISEKFLVTMLIFSPEIYEIGVESFKHCETDA